MNSIRSQFLLKPDVVHLNHGSFGACPKPIFEDYQKWQLEFEKDTFDFFVRQRPELLRKSREALGNFIGCAEEDLVLTMNPSYAMNIIANSFPLEKGDEILTTDLEYGAMDRTWNYYCQKSSAKYARQKISLPVTSKEQVVEEFFEGLTAKTKAIFISHITSSTALLLPVEEICAKAKEKGLITIVDGAHVPGQIPLDLSKLQADIYTGACHKWLLTPKGCSFLYVRKELQKLFDPLVISWGYEADFPSHSQFQDYHQLQGTRDFSAFVTIPKAMEFRKEFDWENVSANCRNVVAENKDRFAEVCGGSTVCSNEFLVQMCSVELDCNEPMELQKILFEKYRMEIPVFKHDDKVFIRFSYQGYNLQDDLEALFNAFEEIRSSTKLLG